MSPVDRENRTVEHATPRLPPQSNGAALIVRSRARERVTAVFAETRLPSWPGGTTTRALYPDRIVEGDRVVGPYPP